MNEQGKIRLRDGRKPCHFWVDNEAVDCYQPIVGADAIWVYCRIARYAHGAWIVSPKQRGTDARVSLREMAEWCGKSPDTVWRCLQMLALVGLIHVERGTKSAGRYALVDVKELVLSEGGDYNRELGVFCLPDERVVELQEQIKVLRARMARKNVAAVTPSSVAQSDSVSGQLFSVPDVEGDRSVALARQNCRSRATASINQYCKTAKTTTPPNPLVAEGECAHDQNPAAQSDELQLLPGELEHLARCSADQLPVWQRYYREEAQKRADQAKAKCEIASAQVSARNALKLGDVRSAGEWVMRQCGWVENRRGRGLGKVVEDVLMLEVEQGAELADVSQSIAQAWKRYCEVGSKLRVIYGALKWLKLGIWKHESLWCWRERIFG